MTKPMTAVDTRVLPSPRMTLEQAREQLIFTTSHQRLDEIMEMLWDLGTADWLTILGENWTSCDYIAPYRDKLRKWLGSEGPIMEMMTPTEQAAYAALPEIVTVYRGCGPSNLRGASWSLDRDVANEFPSFARYRTDVPVVVTARVRKSHILAVKLDREEAEVITFSARAIKTEPATPPALPVTHHLDV
ncbi:MAG: hypothetical protein M3O31_16015 [Acidobacteriota bacterium]|nr:hypothetical protein [Acidobacteriota bacterium]